MSDSVSPTNGSRERRVRACQVGRCARGGACGLYRRRHGVKDTTVYAEFCQVLAELEMLSHGTVTNYAASGGGTGADTRDPTGESPDDDYREYVLTAARVGHRYRRQDDRPWGTLAAA